MLSEACNTVEVEEQTAGVLIVERGCRGTIDAGDCDGTGNRTVGHSECDGAVGAVNLQVGYLLPVGEYHCEWHIRVVDEIVAVQGGLGASLGIFTRHGVDGRCRNHDAESVFDGVLARSNHIDFVRHLLGNRPWYGYDKRVIRDKTGVEDSLLVVEIQFIDTAEVVTHKAEEGLRRGTGH